MNLQHLRCFVVAADELHFGRAAQKLAILPAALGRFIRLLEDDLGARLFARTTRTVELTEQGRRLLDDARHLIAQADAIRARFKDQARTGARKLRVGAIDSAAIGLLPLLLNDVRRERPDIEVELLEDKTIRLLPRIVSGRLDLAFVRPPNSRDPNLVFRPLFHETPVVAIASSHRLAHRGAVAIADIAEEPLIVPDRRSRPHSHDLTIKLFEEAGYRARVAQVADEKQTIVNLVSAGLGIAIVPRWTSRMTLAGVAYLPLRSGQSAIRSRLPLAAVWLRNSRDALRDDLIQILTDNLKHYSKEA